MNPIYTSDKAALAVFKTAYPETNFRSIQVQQFSGPMNLNSYWDSGYRDYFVLVDIATGQVRAHVPQNGTPFDGKNLELSELPSGTALAVHHYSGVRQSGTLYLNAADITPMLPPPVELTWAERVVLVATRSLKPAFRFASAQRDTGIRASEWETARAELTRRGYLNRAGAITNEGRNICPGIFTQLYDKSMQRPAEPVAQLVTVEERLTGE